MAIKQIQFRYAFSLDQDVVDIEELGEADRKDYICIGCGHILRPVLPKSNRKKHFRHKQEQSCSFETYLHRMGKLLFEKTYNNCLKNGKKYNIDYLVPVYCIGCSHGPCPKKNETRSFDLTTAFKVIEIEQKDERFIPDITLKTQSGDNVLYIEIAVSHESSTEKINSGKKIIEFSIISEVDLDILKQTNLHTNNHLITYYNFSPKTENRTMHESCPYYVDYFQVNPDGKCDIDSIEMYNYDKLQNKDNYYINKISHKSREVFRKEVEIAILKGVNAKNCFACRYHAHVTDGSFLDVKPMPIFCKKYKKYRTSNYAIQCERYSPDPIFFTYN